MTAQRSIVICGGAFAGLALALALRQGLGTQIRVVVADPALAARPSRDPRATAIVAACRRLFEAIGHPDKEMHEISGANHYYSGPDQRGTLRQAVAVCTDWLHRHGFSL